MSLLVLFFEILCPWAPEVVVPSTFVVSVGLEADKDGRGAEDFCDEAVRWKMELDGSQTMDNSEIMWH